MSSNGETLSEKPKGVDADSFPGPIKPTGTSYVSSGLSNGDPHSKKTKSEASVSSGLIKPSGKTGVSSGLSIGVPNSKNPDCKNLIFWLSKLYTPFDYRKKIEYEAFVI